MAHFNLANVRDTHWQFSEQAVPVKELPNLCQRFRHRRQVEVRQFYASEGRGKQVGFDAIDDGRTCWTRSRKNRSFDALGKITIVVTTRQREALEGCRCTACHRISSRPLFPTSVCARTRSDQGVIEGSLGSLWCSAATAFASSAASDRLSGSIALTAMMLSDTTRAVVNEMARIVSQPNASRARHLTVLTQYRELPSECRLVCRAPQMVLYRLDGTQELLPSLRQQRPPSIEEGFSQPVAHSPFLGEGLDGCGGNGELVQSRPLSMITRYEDGVQVTIFVVVVAARIAR